MIAEKIKKLSEEIMIEAAPIFAAIDETAQINTEKVQSAFNRHRVSEACFAATTGYGYNDKGRETMNAVFADIMQTPAALVSANFVSGTHAITSALFAALKPGQVLLSVTGLPYDTLHSVIGINDNLHGSLKEFGIGYAQIELKNDGSPDLDAISDYITASESAGEKAGCIGALFVQRSRGYASRRALTAEEIGQICKCVKECENDTGRKINIVVDNCYCEFVEPVEPGETGADIIAGSLIKNPGGGLVQKGGYIAGNEELVIAAADRLAAPGIGMHTGASPEGHRLLYQGLFMAPHIVAQAHKTAVYAAGLFELLGYETHPKFNDMRSDIIQEIALGCPKKLEKFCKGIQSAAPVDSFVTPVGGEMPGYKHQVIMAAGTFIQGASIELSSDAPIREPYSVFLQGSLTFESGRYSIMTAATYLEQN